MRLKRLEAYGFKSFADRLTFDFEGGITAIIGPNGCGKSNVVDAVKWVVGEQSAKALRGSEMTDVIFNGCATRRVMPFAEVTLTLEHDAVEGGEVAITRRLTRDGQSGYFLNGKPSRLKDIKEVLMGTGVGNSAYSVIEQGRIGFILEASTKDRRAILEEAAGISRYKARRRVAARKLDRVETDLERIGQVLGEVGRRARSVRRQAETALTFQELSSRLRDLRMVFALEEFGRLSADMQRHDESIAELQDSEAAAATRLGQLEAELSGADTELLDIEQRVRSIENERSESRAARDVAESQVRDAKQRLIEIANQEQEDRLTVTERSERVATIEREKQDTTNSLSSADAGSDAELGRIYGERREQLDGMLAEIDGLIGEIEDRKGREVECLRELARVDAEEASLNGAAKAAGERRQRLQVRRVEQDGSLDVSRQREELARTAVASLEVAAAAAHALLDDFIRIREETHAAAGSIDSQLNDIRHDEGRAEVRLRLLAEYERKLEGVFRGVKDVLQQMDRLPGICGLVADLFTVEKDHERAIETALGGRVQNIVTDTQEAAKGAIDFLKRERRGRATFLPLDDVRTRARPSKALLAMPGVVGLASDLVTFERKFERVFDHLLNGTVVCESLDHAIAVRRQHRDSGALLVTLEGEVINSGGAMTGGRQQGQDSGGLVTRKNEIKRLEQQLGELTAKRTELATKRETIQKDAFDRSIAVEDQRKKIQVCERTLGEAKSELTKSERDRTHLEEFADSFSNQLVEIDGELSSIESDQRDLAGQREWFTKLREKLEGELAQQQEKLHARGAERDRVQEEVNNLRVNLATTEERREALRNHLGHLNRQLTEVVDQVQAAERRIAGHLARHDELEQQTGVNQAVFDEQRIRFESLSVQLSELTKRRDELRSASESERQEARQLGAKKRDLEHKRQNHELKSQEIRVRIEGLSTRILEDYELELAEAFSHYERPDDLNLPELRRDLTATEQQLSKLGPVNLAAIDELKEAEAREEFLGQQHGDLTAARDKLADIITKIDDVSRRLFVKTYKEVRRNFQDLFRKLYGGGKADLVLETDADNPDVLEAGIEIIAQPPGKQPKSITLLSGGEKALTAIALLFAVYRTKPSPFCILDEVDAPLDESNTDVYCSMVREFVKDSQFLVITHNKRTMQFADAVYGITQQERGVSTKISVKLDEVKADDSGEVEYVGAERTSVDGRGPFSD